MSHCRFGREGASQPADPPRCLEKITHVETGLGQNRCRKRRVLLGNLNMIQKLSWKKTTFSFISAKVSKKKECLEGSSDPIGDNHHYCVIS